MLGPKSASELRFRELRERERGREEQMLRFGEMHLSFIKDKGGGAVVGVGVAVDTVIVFGADSWVLVVEESVGAVTLGV